MQAGVKETLASGLNLGLSPREKQGKRGMQEVRRSREAKRAGTAEDKRDTDTGAERNLGK